MQNSANQCITANSVDINIFFKLPRISHPTIALFCIYLHGSKNKKPCKSISLQGSALDCHQKSGGRGIRTPGPVTRTTVFKTAAFDRSAIPPGRKSNIIFR